MCQNLLSTFFSPLPTFSSERTSEEMGVSAGADRPNGHQRPDLAREGPGAAPGDDRRPPRGVSERARASGLLSPFTRLKFI